MSPNTAANSSSKAKTTSRSSGEAGRQLADLTRRTLQAREPAIEPKAEKALESASDLADRLTKASLTRSEALKDMANVADKLRDELRELGKDPALKRLEQAARASGASDSASPAGLQKQIESMQKQLGAPTGNPEAMDKLKKELRNSRRRPRARTTRTGWATRRNARNSRRRSRRCRARRSRWGCRCRRWTAPSMR